MVYLKLEKNYWTYYNKRGFIMNDELRRYLDLCDSLDELDKKDKEKREHDKRLSEEIVKSKEDCRYR